MEKCQIKPGMSLRWGKRSIPQGSAILGPEIIALIPSCTRHKYLFTPASCRKTHTHTYTHTPRWKHSENLCLMVKYAAA